MVIKLFLILGEVLHSTNNLGELNREQASKEVEAADQTKSASNKKQNLSGDGEDKTEGAKPSRKKYRTMFLEKFLAAADGEELRRVSISASDSGEEGVPSDGEKSCGKDAETGAEIVGRSANTARMFSVKDIEQVLPSRKTLNQEIEKEITAEEKVSVTQAESSIDESFGTTPGEIPDQTSAGVSSDLTFKSGRTTKEAQGLLKKTERIPTSQLDQSSSDKLDHDKIGAESTTGVKLRDQMKHSQALFVCYNQATDSIIVPISKHPTNVLKKSRSWSSLDSFKEARGNILMSSQSNVSHKVYKTCYVQTDESCFASGRDEEGKSSFVQNASTSKGVASSSQEALQAAGELMTKVIFEKAIVEAKKSHGEKDGQSGTDDGNFNKIKKVLVEDESESDEDEYEIEYLFVDEDGNELPLDEQALADSLELLEDSGDEIDLIYDDDESDDELVLYLNDEGEYVDEDGNLVLGIGSDDEITDDDILYDA